MAITSDVGLSQLTEVPRMDVTTRAVRRAAKGDDPFYSTWMQTMLAPDTPLSQICFPASHDSGTYWLSDTPITTDPDLEEVAKILIKCEDIAKQIDDIPGIGALIPNAPAWTRDCGLAAFRQVSHSTHRTISEQLADGIRCLDLRIFYGTGSDQSTGFYAYHGLVGGSVSSILNEVATFLSESSGTTPSGDPTGEIVYVTMGHWQGFDTDATFQDFADLVQGILGDCAYLQAPDGSNSNLLAATYQEVLTQGDTAPASSRVILVMDWLPTQDSQKPYFWPVVWSPPDNYPPGGRLWGWYTNTTDEKLMIQAQQGQYNTNEFFYNMNGTRLPFALYLTLTPQSNDMWWIFMCTLGDLVLKAAALALLIPFVGIDISAALGLIAAGLDIANKTVPWNSIEELCSNVDKNLFDIANSISALDAPQKGAISFLYVDFYESTDVVDLAIMYSAGGGASLGWHEWGRLPALQPKSGRTVTGAWGTHNPPPRLDVFQTSAGGTTSWGCYHTTYDPTAGWGDWAAIPGQSPYPGSTMSPAWGLDDAGPRLDLLMIGPEDSGHSTCYWNLYRPSAGWGGWQAVTQGPSRSVYGCPGATIAAVWWRDYEGARLDIFMSGTDGACWWNSLRSYVSGNSFDQWYEVQGVKGYHDKTPPADAFNRWITPVCCVDAQGPRLDVFMIGAKGKNGASTCYWNVYRPFLLPPNDWRGWQEVQNDSGQKVYGQPGCSISPQWWSDQNGLRLDIFMSGTNGTGWWNSLRPDGSNAESWAGWRAVAEEAVAEKGATFSPAAYVGASSVNGQPARQLSVFVERKRDGLAVYSTLDPEPSSWSAWTPVDRSQQAQFQSLTTITSIWSGAFEQGAPLTPPQLDLLVTDDKQNCWWNYYGPDSGAASYVMRSAARLLAP